MARRRAAERLDAAKLGPVLHELMPIGGGEPPLEVLGYRNAAKQCRRMVAVYPDGWRLTVRLNAQMEVTSVSASLRLTIESPKRA